MNFMAIAKLSELIQSLTFENVTMFFNYIQIFVFGIVAVFLSALSISGTWFILFSMIIFKFIDTHNKVSWLLIVIYILICLLVEFGELYAVKHGIKKAGGSSKSEVTGIIGGITGSILGEIIIPIPILGNLIGMFLLSFISVYFVEYRQLKCKNTSIKVAWMGILAKVFMILFKLLITAAMFIYLVYTIF